MSVALFASIFCKRRRLAEALSALPEETLMSWRTNAKQIKGFFGFSPDELDHLQFANVHLMDNDQLAETDDLLGQALEALS